MNREVLKELWHREEKASFQGWDFSHLKGRWQEEDLPWDYREFVLANLQDNDQLLDMGTGGGEFLLTLHHPYSNTSVTESWAPNIQLIQRRLAPLGIHIYPAKNQTDIPCPDNCLDRIINKHTAFDIRAIRRALRPNGLFITQQVGCYNNADLCQFLIPNFKTQFPIMTLDQNVKRFKSAGFNVETARERFVKLRFFDVGAIVYYAKIIQWEFPDFSVDRCFDALYALQQRIIKKGFIETHEHRFLLIARNIKD
ncbi:MAG: class I SAM-dependent methyltransferase [Sporolactobacillus sp.]